MKNYIRNKNFIPYVKGTDFILMPTSDEFFFLKGNHTFQTFWNDLTLPKSFQQLGLKEADLQKLIETQVLLETELSAESTAPGNYADMQFEVIIPDEPAHDVYAQWPFPSDS